jgi:CRP/FNR family cyclic AMP-dependent transcriptional regulator
VTDVLTHSTLRRTALFGMLPDQDLDAVSAASRLRTFRRGQIVFSYGDPGDSVVVVVSGRVKVAVHSADGGELTLTIVEAGGTIGEVSVADGGVRSADAETIDDDTQLLFVSRQAAQEVCRRVPAAAEALSRLVAASLRRLTEATADLVFLDLPRRVAKLLLEHPRRTDGVVDLGLSQEELAHRVGGTRQSVNLALRGFERRGWITAGGQTVVIADQAALERFAGR